jgi:dTDP-4-dehydrorhamnose 3,5-epimerase
MSTAPANGRFELMPLAVPGVFAVRRGRVGDARGSLSRMFCAQELAVAGWRWPLAQINHARTELAGTVRGLHFQNPPHEEAKLISCLRGRAWDVAVDLRRDSPTFLRWCAQEISADNETAMLIPPGCAHGFQALTDGVELVYAHSAPHVPHAEGGLSPLDPDLAITWPLPVERLSSRDASHPWLGATFTGLASPRLGFRGDLP